MTVIAPKSATIFALATPALAQPQALLRISGLLCPAISHALLNSPFQAGAIDVSILTRLGPVPCRAWLFPGPATLTGEDVIELRFPGNPRIVSTLELQLIDLGCRRAQAGEFTRRALAAGKLDLTRAEAISALINASSQTERRLALSELSGESARALSVLTEALRRLSAGYELAFDFSEDDDHAPPFAQLGQELSTLATAVGRFSNVVPLRTQREFPVIAIFGLPNAGKSSLFNAIVGRARALVSPMPGTTRDPVRTRLQLGEQQVELCDLSGVGDSDSDAARFATRARELASNADVLLALCAPSQDSELAREYEVLRALDPELPARTVWVRSMADCGNVAPADARLRSWISVSAHTGTGVQQLLARAAELISGMTYGASLSQLRLKAGEAALVLAAAATGLKKDPPEYTAGQVRMALRLLDDALVAQAPGEVLDMIFSRFCIGK